MFLKKVFILLLLIFPAVPSVGQPVVDSLSGHDKQKQQKEYYEQAMELYNSFKNGPAFELLEDYSKLKEKNFKEQKTAELQQMDSLFREAYAANREKLSEINNSISSLRQENESLEKEKAKMTRNTFLFFAILISILIIVLVTRITMSKKAQAQAGVSVIQLNRTVNLAEITGAVIKIQSDLKFAFRSVADVSSKSLPAVSRLRSISVNQKKNAEALPLLEESMNHIYSDAENAVVSISGIEQQVETAEEKSMTNLNNLISDVFELSCNWIKSFDESFECGRVTDLEKILPEISIMPKAVHVAMFHFFNNAFYAVYDKKRSAGKGYELKISVSSRKLPRFVQVRIKDNGSGIDDKITDKIYAPFFTTKPPEIANGLGLTKSAEVINKKHGGEIIVESEAGKGTDVIIRFPLNNLM